MQRSNHHSAGMTLPELLLAVLVLGLMGVVAAGGCQRSLARMRVEAAARQLAAGLEVARSGAHTTGTACALVLDAAGWVSGEGSADLPPCPMREGPLDPQVQLRHNLPTALRISSNGLLIDGGTLVVGTAGSDLQRCLVVSLPLGVVRIGRSMGAPRGAVRSSDCVVDVSL